MSRFRGNKVDLLVWRDPDGTWVRMDLKHQLDPNIRFSRVLVAPLLGQQVTPSPKSI